MGGTQTGSMAVKSGESTGTRSSKERFERERLTPVREPDPIEVLYRPYRLLYECDGLGEVDDVDEHMSMPTIQPHAMTHGSHSPTTNRHETALVHLYGIKKTGCRGTFDPSDPDQMGMLNVPLVPQTHAQVCKDSQRCEEKHQGRTALTTSENMGEYLWQSGEKAIKENAGVYNGSWDHSNEKSMDGRGWVLPCIRTTLNNELRRKASNSEVLPDLHDIEPSMHLTDEGGHSAISPEDLVTGRSAMTTVSTPNVDSFATFDTMLPASNILEPSVTKSDPHGTSHLSYIAPTKMPTVFSYSPIIEEGTLSELYRATTPAGSLEPPLVQQLSGWKRITLAAMNIWRKTSESNNRREELRLNF